MLLLAGCCLLLLADSTLLEIPVYTDLPLIPKAVLDSQDTPLLLSLEPVDVMVWTIVCLRLLCACTCS